MQNQSISGQIRWRMKLFWTSDQYWKAQALKWNSKYQILQTLCAFLNDQGERIKSALYASFFFRIKNQCSIAVRLGPPETHQIFGHYNQQTCLEGNL